MPTNSTESARSLRNLYFVRTVFQGEPVPAVLAEAILAKAQGNPFFLEELAQTLVEQGAAGHPGLQLPLTVQGVLAARLDRLPQEAKHLVQCAADNTIQVFTFNGTALSPAAPIKTNGAPTGIRTAVTGSR